MVESHCEIMWANKPANQEIITQHRLRSNMLGLCTKNSLTTNAKRKLWDFKSEYTLNTQYYGYEMLFVIVKMVRPDTLAGFSDIKSDLENINMYYFKQDIPKANLQIS